MKVDKGFLDWYREGGFSIVILYVIFVCKIFSFLILESFRKFEIK